MQCPYCSHTETKVVDKRDFGKATKRRRECLKCEQRFTTQEIVELAELKVVKKNGQKEPFDREKIKLGISRACEKRPITAEMIEKMINLIQENAMKRGGVIKTSVIGEMISRKLKKLDKVAYIRFASVYREFADISDFKKEIKELIKK